MQLRTSSAGALCASEKFKRNFSMHFSVCRSLLAAPSTDDRRCWCAHSTAHHSTEQVQYSARTRIVVVVVRFSFYFSKKMFVYFAVCACVDWYCARAFCTRKYIKMTLYFAITFCFRRYDVLIGYTGHRYRYTGGARIRVYIDHATCAVCHQTTKHLTAA